MLNYYFNHTCYQMDSKDLQRFVNSYPVRSGRKIEVLPKLLSKEYIHSVLKLLQFLGNRGFQVPIPIFQKNGSLVDSGAKNEQMVMLSTLSGNPLSSFSENEISQIAKMVGKLHRATSKFNIENAIPSQKFDAPNHKWGICHNLLTKESILFSNGELNGVRNFFHVMKMPYLIDFASVAIEFCLNEKGIPNFNLINLAIANYQNEFPLPKDEWKSLVYFMNLMAKLRFEQGNEKEERYKNLIQFFETTKIGVSS